MMSTPTEGKVARVPLRNLIASAVIWLLGSVLLGPTRAMAEENMNTALRAYDSANSTDRKTEEIVFLNAQAGIWWANSVLFYRKQQPLFCPPDNAAPVPGAQVIEMVRRQVDENPMFGEMPYGLAVLMTLQKTFPCRD
jgi:hypothetical protein